VDVRETLNRNRALLLPSVAVIVVLACVVVFRQATGSDRPSIPRRAYYTADDGATFFVDDISRVPPFNYGGKTAVRANVFDCGGQKFVGYLLRYTADAKAKIEAAHGEGVGSIMADGTEVKPPLTADSNWINANKPGAARVYAVHCPGGSSDQPESVMP
jgi:hypothetical protein